MIDFNTAEKKKELLFARYELINYSTEKFMKTYNSENLYREFLSRLETIMVLDSDFILLGDNMDKYREIINRGRFRFHTKGELRNYENLTLITLNDQELTKREYKVRYLVDQLKIRLMYKDDNIAFLFSERGEEYIENKILEFSKFDYTYLEFMTMMQMGLNIKTKEESIKFVSTIHYLLNNAIEIYQQEPGYIDSTISVIDTLEEKSLLPDGYNMEKAKRKLNRMSKKR